MLRLRLDVDLLSELLLEQRRELRLIELRQLFGLGDEGVEVLILLPTEELHTRGYESHSAKHLSG